MNKNCSFRSLLVLSGFFLSSMAMANPISSPVHIIANPVGLPSDIVCPSTQGTSNVITNFGNYIAGYGTEFMLSNSLPIYFKSGLPTAGTPRKLAGYFNESTDYDSTTGKVSCNYVSNNLGEPAFSVDYFLTNGQGGVVVAQSNNSISLLFQVGVKKG
jgi:hypothetical protein